MRIREGDRVFFDPPEGLPDWLYEHMPARGSSGKADFVMLDVVWVRWGGGNEEWIPRSWLGDASVLQRAE
jgi:hypothetical protein